MTNVVDVASASSGQLWSDGAIATADAYGLVLKALAGRLGFHTAVAGVDGTIYGIDRAGTVYSFNSKNNSYSRICSVKAAPTATSLSPDGKRLYIGLADGSLHTVLLESGEVLKASTRNTGTVAILYISVHPSGGHVVTTSSEVCMVWERAESGVLRRKRALHGAQSVGVAQSLFTPDGRGVLTCLRNDTVLVWDFPAFNLRSTLPLPANSPATSSTDKPRVYFRGFVASADGSLLAAGARDGMVYVWSLESRDLLRAIELPASAQTARKIEFVASNGPADKVMAILCLDGTVRFVNAATGHLVSLLGGASAIADFAFSDKDGAFAVVDFTGALCVYDVGAVLPARAGRAGSRQSSDSRRSFVQRASVGPSAHPDDDVHLVDLEVPTQMLNKAKLEELLHKYGEYPVRYRRLVWQFLLQLPGNRDAFEQLQRRGMHRACKELLAGYTFSDPAQRQSFESLLSALCYWSPVLQSVPWLPPLAFSFFSVFGQGSTVSWCQGWFDFFPNPPLGVLKVAEGLLAQHDPEMLRHFNAVGIGPDVYAWALLQSAFADVLTADQWAALWDHLFTVPPRFMYFFLVAYLIQFRSALLRCTRIEDFDYFFHHDNPVVMAEVLASARRMYCNSDITSDPTACLEDFIPIAKGQYPVFNKHPLHALEYRLRERDNIAREEELFLRQWQPAPTLAANTKEVLDAQVQSLMRAQREARDVQRMRVDMTREEMEKLREARKRTADMQREQRIREITLLQNRIAHATRELETSNQLEMERVAVELELRRKMREDEYEDSIMDVQLRQIELDIQRVELEEELQRQKNRTADEIEAILQAHADEEEKLTQALRKEYESIASEKDAWDQVFQGTLQKAIEQAREHEMHAKLAAELRKSEVQRDVRLLELERELRLARIKEEELRLGAMNLVTNEQRERARRAAEDADSRELTNQRLRWVRAQAEERKKRFDRERRKQLLELEIRQERLKEMEKSGHLREHQARLDEVLRHEQQFAEEEEARIQQLQAAADDQRRRDAELDRLLADGRWTEHEKLKLQRNMLEEIDAKISYLRTNEAQQADMTATSTSDMSDTRYTRGQ